MINSELGWHPRRSPWPIIPLAAAGGLAIFLVGGFTGYVVGTREQPPAAQAPRRAGTTGTSPASSRVAAPTAGWETYTNRQHGYSIKYPRELAASIAASEHSLIVNFPGPSDSPLLRIDVYETSLDPSNWWNQVGRRRYPWLFNAALNRVEPSDPQRYGELAGLKGLEVIAQRQSPGGVTLPASVLLLPKGDRLFVVIDDTARIASDAEDDDWRQILATFSFVRRESRR